MTPPMTDTYLAEAIRKAELYDPAVEISPSYSLYKREAMLFARALLHYRDENLTLRSRLAAAEQLCEEQAPFSTQERAVQGGR